MKILLVDDDPDVAEFVRITLASAGHSVEHAPDGAAGIQAARSNRPDLIILDVLMPKKDGLTTFEEIAADSTLRDTPVIMLTSVNERLSFGYSADDMETHYGIRPAAFLEKPVDSKTLLQTITEAGRG